MPNDLPKHEAIALLKSRVMALCKGEDQFEDLALAIFRFQAVHNPVFNNWLKALNKDVRSVKHYTEIPCIPIEFFKHQHVSVYQPDELKAYTVFKSSGTTGQTTSQHLVADLEFYHKVAAQLWINQFGNLDNWVILALLPGYLERGHSSLISMVQSFIDQADPRSGFYLNRSDDLIALLETLKGQPDKKVLVWGVTYSLLDWAEHHPETWPAHFHLLETGGMKGKRKELIREELHTTLQTSFNVQKVWGEYGMTELLSQAYSTGDGIYSPGASIAITIRDDRDPFQLLEVGKRGLVNVIDLANIESCAFVATQDIGEGLSDQQFRILGRADAADVRGCNLLI